MAFLNRLRTHFSGDTKQLQKQTNAIKIGILGAADIANMALINPASKLPNAFIYGIAARDRQRAETYARKHHIPKVYDNYDQLLADPEIQVIYNPLPNSLHYEWTLKALRLGKHVLCEKPLANNVNEAREMIEEAKKQNRLLVEAFHYQYHPLCINTLKTLLSNKDQHGEMKTISAIFTIPRGFLKTNDIRFNYSLGGGAQMDLGCYLVSMIRFIVNSSRNRIDDDECSFNVIKAEPQQVDPTNPQIDFGMRSEILFDGVQCNLYCAFTNDWSRFRNEIIIECEKVTITIAYLLMPTIYHYITVRQRETGQSQTIKNYDDNHTTYYYQLKAFCEAVNKFEQSSIEEAYEIVYTNGKSSIRNMEIIDEIYRKAGLVVRGTEI